MKKLDGFMLTVPCNAEVTEINQDAPGGQARVVGKPGTELLLSKPLEDGAWRRAVQLEQTVAKGERGMGETEAGRQEEITRPLAAKGVGNCRG